MFLTETLCGRPTLLLSSVWRMVGTALSDLETVAVGMSHIQVTLNVAES